MKKVLQFCIMPPPVGGVTIHVSRLSARLKEEAVIENRIFDYSRNKNLMGLFRSIMWADFVHIHLSNKKVRQKLPFDKLCELNFRCCGILLCGI